jgi:hypothetical protein
MGRTEFDPIESPKQKMIAMELCVMHCATCNSLGICLLDTIPALEEMFSGQSSGCQTPFNYYFLTKVVESIWSLSK